MRARNIKPGFFKNENLGDIDPLARLLFIGLWCMADKEGRLEDRPKRIKAEVLPYDSGNVEKLLEQLHTTQFIVRYEDEETGNRYIAIPNFAKHQNPHKNEKPSDIPCFTKCREITGAAPEKHRTNRADSLIPDSLIPDSLIPDCLTSSERSPEPSEPPVLEIILNTKELHPITQADIDDWANLFPAVDVLGQLRKMVAWCQANPQRRKTDRGIRKFIVSWLMKEQDKGHKVPAVTGGGYDERPMSHRERVNRAAIEAFVNGED